MPNFRKLEKWPIFGVLIKFNYEKNLIYSSYDVLVTSSKTNTFSGSTEKTKTNGGISKSKKEAHLFEKVSEFLIEAFRSD